MSSYRSLCLTMALLVLFTNSCSSENASVGSPETITASGTLTLTGSAVREIPDESSSFTPNKGAEILNQGSYILKFDDTTRAIDLMYAEETGNEAVNYHLSWSQITVDNVNAADGYDWEAQSEGKQISGITVDKSARKITFKQVSMTGITGSTLILDGILYIQP